MTHIPVMIKIIGEVVSGSEINGELSYTNDSIKACYQCGATLFYQSTLRVENTKHAISTDLYCAVCGVLNGGMTSDPFDEVDISSAKTSAQVELIGELLREIAKNTGLGYSELESMVAPIMIAKALKS